MRDQMRAEIDGLLSRQAKEEDEDEGKEAASDGRRKKYEEMQRQLTMQLNAGPAD